MASERCASAIAPGTRTTRLLPLPPASMRHTLRLGSSDKRAASAQPAVPAPTTTKSNPSPRSVIGRKPRGLPRPGSLTDRTPGLASALAGGRAMRLVAVDLDHHVVDDVPADGRLLAWRSLRARFLGTLAAGGKERRDGLASLDLAAAVVEDAVGRERAGIALRIAVVEGEHVARLQIFDEGTVIAITGVGDTGDARQGGCGELYESAASHGRSPRMTLFHISH